MNDKAKAAAKLTADIKSKIAKWNERSTFTIKGVKNLSMSDLDTLELYANSIATFGHIGCSLMEPRGSIKEVLEKYSLI